MFSRDSIRKDLKNPQGQMPFALILSFQRRLESRKSKISSVIPNSTAATFGRDKGDMVKDEASSLSFYSE